MDVGHVAERDLAPIAVMLGCFNPASERLYLDLNFEFEFEFEPEFEFGFGFFGGEEKTNTDGIDCFVTIPHTNTAGSHSF